MLNNKDRPKRNQKIQRQSKQEFSLQENKNRNNGSS